MHRGSIKVALVALTFMFPDSLDFNYNPKYYSFVLTVHVALTKINCTLPLVFTNRLEKQDNGLFIPNLL